MTRLALAVVCGLWLGSVLLADEPKKLSKYEPPLGYVCYRTKGEMTIDGRLTDAEWGHAPWSEEFVDIEGDKKPKPRHRTRVKMLWDDSCLYIAARLDEPHVWGTLKKHDSVIFHDNDFEVFLDADGDNHVYSELELNALNTTWDLLLTKPYKDRGRAINAWEILGLRTAVRIEGTLNDPSDEDRGWTVEIAWPFRGQRELSRATNPPKAGDQWRINFSRVQWLHTVENGKYLKVKGKREDNWVWSPQGVINMHRPETWGYLQFSDAKPGAETFRPDARGPIRHALHELYYAQKAFQKEHGRWAKTVAELGFDVADLEKLGTLRMDMTATRFEITLTPKGDASKGWHIGSDSRIWQE